MNFAYPWVLGFLLLVPLLAAWLFMPRFRAGRRGTFLFSKLALLDDQPRSYKIYLEPLPDLLKVVALALLVVALARPQGITAQEVEVEGIDIYLALDMSGSMRAIDLERDEIRRLEARGERPRSRFENAVATLEEFVRGRKYDRIGMVVFAKNAFLQFPLTLDYSTILHMLGRLDLGDIDEGGTAIGNALGRAIGGLAESEAETKIIILITDGDRRGGNISPMKAAELAAREDIKIYPILVGKSGETLVPVGRNLLSRRLSYREMKFPVDPELLEKIAEKTGGSYYRATEPESLRDGLHVILDRYERSRLRDDTNVEYDENYVAFAWWAALLLAAAFALEHTWLRRFP